jgi:hypothetical protein
MKNKTYFIAWDIDETYTLDKDVIPINLNWDCSIYTWIATVREKNIQDDDVVIGHSIGATVALLAQTKGILKLYSPSPIFKEAKHLLSEDGIKQLGNKYDEIDSYSIKDVKLKPTCYIGEKELPLMYKTLEEIKGLGLIKSYIVPNADHGDVINHSGIIKYDETN